FNFLKEKAKYIQKESSPSHSLFPVAKGQKRKMNSDRVVFREKDLVIGTVIARGGFSSVHKAGVVKSDRRSAKRGNHLNKLSVEDHFQVRTQKSLLGGTPNIVAVKTVTLYKTR